MEVLLNFAILIGACVLIFKTTDYFVHGAVDLAAAFHLPKVFVGVTLVSLLTTAPEFIVSVSSSYLGNPGMAVGNALGSCICNIGLVFATGIMLKEVVVHKNDFKYKLSFLVGVLLLMYAFITNNVISYREGIFLLVILVFFLVINYRVAIKDRESLITEVIHPDQRKVMIKKGTFYFLIGGIGTVLLARYGMVTTGINIATALKVPPIIIGLTMIAVGTSLPELFTAIIASRKGHSEIALGNVIGANILNLLLVLGASSLINPLTIDRQTVRFTMPAVLVLTLVMFFLGWNDLRYHKREGRVLLACYILYLTLLFTVIY